MMKRKILVASVLCSISCMNAVMPVYAEENVRKFILPTVVVEGIRDTLPETYPGGMMARGARAGILGNKDFMDTPFITNAYTSNLIKNSQAQTVAEVAMNDPSVRFQYPSGTLIDNYYIRGFTYNTNNMSMNGLMGLAPYGTVATEMLERVEIQRGPNALVNGMNPGNEVSGNINLVPKRAEYEPVKRFSVDYTSKGKVGGHIDLGERFGKDKEFGVRFNGVYRDGRAGVDDQKQKRELASISMDYTKGKSRTTLDAYYVKNKFSDAVPSVIQIRGEVPKAPKATVGLKGLDGWLESKAVLLHTDYSFTKDISAYAGYGKSWNKYEGFIGGGNFLQTNGSTGLGILYISNDKVYVDKTAWEAGIRANFKTGGLKHEVVLGTNILNLKTGNNSANYLMQPNTSIYHPSITGEIPSLNSDTSLVQQVDLTSITLADTMKFANDKVQLIVGGRRQKVHQKRYNTDGSLNTDYDKSRISPMYAIVAKPWNDKVSLYASYSEGLSAGNIVPDNPLYRNAGEVFKPYVTKQAEFGVKWDNKNFANTLSFYQIKKVNTFQEIHDDGTRTFHADGEQRNRGIEWMAFGKVSDNLRLIGGITYSNTKVTKAASNAANLGKAAYGIPKWAATLGLEWDAPWNKDLTFTTRMIYSGKQFANSDNSLELPSSTRFDLGARYKTKIGSKPVVFQAAVENLFNKDYWGGCRSDSVLYVGTGRTFKLMATFDL